MILIPEQVYALREKRQRLLEKLASFDDYYKTVETTASETTIASQVGDSLIDDNYQSLLNDIKEINVALETGEYLKERTTDKIAIGTKFVVEMNYGEDDKEELTLTMVEKMVSGQESNGLTSSNSPLGQVVFGKTVDEPFTLMVTDSKGNSYQSATGIIKDIKTEPKEYMHFITEKIKALRICREERTLRKEMLANGEEDAYQERKALTPSQIELLKDEATRLINTTEQTRETRSRLGTIKEILETSKIAELPTGNTIGIGSTFSMMLYHDDGIESRRYEMIDHAVSTELDKEYIERISPMGSHIFGLREGEDFYVKTKDGYLSGTVFDIDNSKEQFKTNSPLEYQLNKSREQRRK